MVDSASTTEATFFVTGVGLVSSRQDLPAEASASERLAWHLLRAPATAPGAREFARASSDPRAQRNTAAYLLDEAITREIAGQYGTALQDLWTAVDEAWLSLAGSAGAAAELSSLAESLGIPAPEEAAGAVLARISTELLPGLHGLFAVKAGDSRHKEFHLKRMDGGQGSAMVAASTHAIARLELAAVRDLRKRVHPELVLQHYLDIKIGDAVERGRLSTEVAELVTKHVHTSEPRSYWAATALLAKVEDAADTFPWDHRIHLALSQLHLQCGLSSGDTGEPLAEVALHLAKAAVIDPSHPKVAEAFAALKSDLHSLVAEVEEALRAGAKLNRHRARNLAAAREALRMAEDFAGSEQGQGLLLSLHEAFWGQLALRLGLDPSDRGAMAAAQALADALTSGGAEATPFSDIREGLIEEHPVLASAPWTAIEEVFTSEAPLTGAQLVVSLPPPPPLEDVTEGQASIDLAYDRMRSAVGRKRAARRGTGRATVYPWLFSRQDRFAKVAAVTGVILMIAGGVLFGVRAWDADRRAVAYDNLRNALTAQRPAEVIAAAQQFIAYTDRGFQDYRVPEVAEAYQQALVQEITRTATAGSDEELSRLLDDARALKAWAPPSPDALMEGSNL